MLLFKRLRIRPALTALFALTLTHCASTEPTVLPIAKTVTLRAPLPENAPPTARPKTLKKNLFHIYVTVDKLMVNGTEVKTLENLQRLLEVHNKPVITMAVHRCVENEYAKQVLTLVQQTTQTPIPYSSTGKLSDPACLE